MNPGFFRTELFTEQSTTYAEPSIEDYAKSGAKVREFWKGYNGKQGGDPAKLAGALLTIADQEAAPAALYRRRRRRCHRREGGQHSSATDQRVSRAVDLAGVR